MTGCYKFVGRNCVRGGQLETCIHCGCPMDKRSLFVPDMQDQHAAQLRVQKRLKYSRVVHDSLRTEKSKQVEEGLKRKSRIREALAETRENLEK